MSLPSDASTHAVEAVVRQEVVIGMPEGLHARPSTLLSKAAANYDGSVKILVDDRVADAKSILDLLSLGLAEGTQLTIEVAGNNAAEKLQSLCAMFETNFSET